MRGVAANKIKDCLPEIVAQSSLEFLERLLEDGLTEDALRAEKLYHKVCGLGGVEYLRWANAKWGLSPDHRCINAAVAEGREAVVEWIAGLWKTLRPGQLAVDRAAGKGKLTMLTQRCAEWRVFPGQ